MSCEGFRKKPALSNMPATTSRSSKVRHGADSVVFAALTASLFWTSAASFITYPSASSSSSSSSVATDTATLFEPQRRQQHQEQQRQHQAERRHLLTRTAMTIRTTLRSPPRRSYDLLSLYAVRSSDLVQDDDDDDDHAHHQASSSSSSSGSSSSGGGGRGRGRGGGGRGGWFRRMRQRRRRKGDAAGGGTGGAGRDASSVARTEGSRSSPSSSSRIHMMSVDTMEDIDMITNPTLATDDFEFQMRLAQALEELTPDDIMPSPMWNNPDDHQDDTANGEKNGNDWIAGPLEVDHGILVQSNKGFPHAIDPTVLISKSSSFATEEISIDIASSPPLAAGADVAIPDNSDDEGRGDLASPATPSRNWIQGFFDRFRIMSQRKVQAVVHNFVSERATTLPRDLAVRVAAPGNVLGPILRAQTFPMDVEVCFRELILPQIRITGCRGECGEDNVIQAEGVNVNLWNFTATPSSRRYLSQFDLRANLTLTQQDLMESPCILGGLRRLLSRILKSPLRMAVEPDIAIKDISLLPSGEISVEGEVGPLLPFRVRTRLGIEGRGRILTFPGLEVSISQLRPLEGLIPEIRLDLGDHAQIFDVDIHHDGKMPSLSLNAMVTTTTPQHTLKLSDYKQISDSYGAHFNFDVGRWLTEKFHLDQ